MITSVVESITQESGALLHKVSLRCGHAYWMGAYSAQRARDVGVWNCHRCSPDDEAQRHKTMVMEQGGRRHGKSFTIEQHAKAADDECYVFYPGVSYGRDVARDTELAALDTIAARIDPKVLWTMTYRTLAENSITTRPTARDVLDLAILFYHMDDNGAGGGLHIVLDDGNVEDQSVQFCYDKAIKDEDVACAQLAQLLMYMTVTQRLKVYRGLRGKRG